MPGESYYGLGILIGLLAGYLILTMGFWGVILGASIAGVVLLVAGTFVGFSK